MEKQNLLQLINNTPAPQIAALDVVREKFIHNYNVAHKSNLGELVYSRQLVFFNQAILDNQKLQQSDKLSLYACFVTAAIKNYSFDPEDDEVYIIPRDGKAKLQPQAGAYIKRLKDTKQIINADQPQLVYQGDSFKVENGRVIEHVAKYESDEIILGFIRFILPNNEDKFFIYRKSDWESWRKKSPNPASKTKKGQFGPYTSESPWDNYTVGGTQPAPGFLRTKIVRHACKEKSWATGQTVVVDTFTDIIAEDIDHEDIEGLNRIPSMANPKTQPTTIEIQQRNELNSDVEEAEFTQQEQAEELDF